jgi:hypothetical protein
LRDNQFPHYDFILESKTNTLEEVKNLISNTRLDNAVNFFQFLVDDMLFFSDLTIFDILRLLDSKWETIYAAHLKLHPGINYSHTTDKLINQLPKLTPTDSSLTYLLFERSETELDWNYPFDFCGSIYLLDRVVEVIENIED